MAQTREVFEIQRFENTFFGLLKLLNDQVESIEADVQSRTVIPDKVNGRKAIAALAAKLPKGNSPTTIVNNISYTTDAAVLSDRFSELYWADFENDLAPYFRLIYNIIRHIEDLKVGKTIQEKKGARIKYSKILRAHLSSAEIKLIMFNCASDHGLGMKSVVEKYKLLRHIRRDDYFEYENTLVAEYAVGAFDWSKRNKENSRK